MKKVKLSVVMATYNRSDLLAKQLIAFATQTLANEHFEIVIVNDGSSDDTIFVLEEWSKKMDNLTFINQVNSGPAVARNTGVDNAKGEIIAFTDDDCIVDNDWLESILKAFVDKNVFVLEGLTYTKKELRTPLTHQIENLSWNPVIPTCNAAYRKQFFVQLGGFDESFPFPHNEDTDLAWRVLEQTELKFCETMRVYHPPIKVKFKSQLKRMRMLISEFILYKKNKTAYKKWRSTNPWTTIYKEVFFKHQFLNLKFHIGFYRRPLLMMQGVLLSIGWWLYLVVLFPKFVKANFN